MGLIPDDFILMPVDDDETYVNHIYLIVIIWTSLVVCAGLALAIVTL